MHMSGEYANNLILKSIINQPYNRHIGKYDINNFKRNKKYKLASYREREVW